MEMSVRPILSHSNSFGNNAERDTAGCRASHRKSIVIGDRFSMSLVQQIIAAVSAAERQIDDQIAKLTSYIREIDKVTNRANAAFDGSTQTYGRDMIQQLAVTKAQVNQAIEKLQVAKEKLLRVRTI